MYEDVALGGYIIRVKKDVGQIEEATTTTATSDL